jgi:gliding motility-associated-like protein
MKDNIKDLFEGALKNQELPVRPELWQGIQNGLTPTAMVAASSKLMLAKIIGGSFAAAALVVGSIYFMNTPDQNIAKKEVAFEQKEIKGDKEVSGKAESEITLTISPKVEMVNEISVSTNSGYELPPDFGLIGCEGGWGKPEILEAPKVFEDSKLDEVDKFNVNSSSTEESVSNEASSLKSVVIETLPNVFTPNGDNANDGFKINIQNTKDFQITILDQNNTTVFRSADPNFEWNGIDQGGNKVAPGEYVYFILGKGKDNKEFKEYRRLTIR